MLDILTDGPFRYIHCRATGELIMTLEKARGLPGFYDFDAAWYRRSLREWKAIARRRMGDRLITDGVE